MQKENINFKFLEAEEIGKNLAERFKNLRIFKNLTQEELSNVSNVNISKIRRFEKNGNIPLVDLIKLLRGLKSLKLIESFLDYSKDLRSIAQMEAIENFDKSKKQRVRKRKA